MGQIVNYPSLPQNLATSNSPTFVNETLTGDLAAVNGSLSGALSLTAQAMTAGDLTVASSAKSIGTWHKFSWTNAMIVALGANAAGDLVVCTLPAKTMVRRVVVVVTGTAAGPATLTLAVGRTGALYIDYIVALDAKVAANTVYGDASAELGTNLIGYDLPSFTGTTAVKMHLIATIATLDGVTGSTGIVYVETVILP